MRPPEPDSPLHVDVINGWPLITEQGCYKLVAHYLSANWKETGRRTYTRTWSFSAADSADRAPSELLEFVALTSTTGR